ncbi:group II intron reverse transcriptase/maturase [Candidatus Formimonas warabiya]|uniref:Group II intron reverse transcriptase/maturase n=2 Tax=Formimonas warabiya TaxID=1761012 RepID=A0A3G1KZG9_FORW1|nr:group II intron reverse transcriptase/maturase [Candidatus Formimonas warabiya]ATW26035.1 group II intron reverse transcriptase/maturase [Candidatus Formimonas warabiya]ATW27936.1 group II intron reverse transcriptase/maturase [Candidatus Formimonas warabiya]
MNVTKVGIKESRIPCCGKGCSQRDSAEHEGYAGALTDRRITENNNTNADSEENGLLERILNRDNLNKAYKQVKRNKGAHGVDGMEVEHISQYLKDNGEELVKLVLDGKYRPNPVRRVEIPKDKGKMRTLGIPTAVDRVLQQAIAQVLLPIFEPQFAETSYGFRPKRSAHDALRKCKEYANEGYTYVVEMDLEKFFDTVNQSKMIEILSRTIRDGRVISLIHKYLTAGAVNRGRFEETELGLVQGGNVSPLCSNIMLNGLDHELERRGIRFVRYADDVQLFAKTKRSAQRMLEHILPFIEDKLLLRVNREKTVVAYIGKVKFLGYGFYPSKDGIKLRVHAKSISKMKAKVKEITSRSNGLGYELLKLKLKQFITGWVNYFKLADMKKMLGATDKWLRRRIRMYIWKQWKKIRTRYAMLKKLGLNHDNAIKFACTRKGYWRIANSHILNVTVTDARLRQAGYVFFSDYLKSVQV